ncbi:MAG: hypothetical protein OEQ39_13250, partial [Gammaproteobacteria bacterium]|nr:hypothetical protein [Gammaproteobacteria bacterium]
MGTILAQWVIRWRFAIVVTAFLALGIAASGGRFLGFTTDYRVFFSADNPQLQAFETLQNTYTKYDNILFVLAPNDSNVFSIETLSA